MVAFSSGSFRNDHSNLHTFATVRGLGVLFCCVLFQQSQNNVVKKRL